jgi:hypothetical protein
MQTTTKIYIGLGLAAAIAAYFVFRPKKSSTIKSSDTSSKSNSIPLMPKPLLKVKRCPDGEMLVGENCVPDKAILLKEYQDYSYQKLQKPDYQFYGSRKILV